MMFTIHNVKLQWLFQVDIIRIIYIIDYYDILILLVYIVFICVIFFSKFK